MANEVEHVALWVGLFSGIVGIVLSIVAITFAILVERHSRAVTGAALLRRVLFAHFTGVFAHG